MTQYDNAAVRELLAKTLRRQKAASRWTLFAAHLFLAAIFTIIAWLVVLTGNEPLGTGAILVTLTAFFGSVIHLRSVLHESGMYQPSAAEALVNELVRQGVDLESLLANDQREKPKRSSSLSLSDDGELVADDAANEPSRQAMGSSAQ